MQEVRFEELESRASALFENEAKTLDGMLQAHSTIQSELEAMRREDKILMLTEEEERMLRSFRGFRARTKPGGVFKWQTRPDDAFMAAPEAVLITDPQDVSWERAQ